MNPSVVNTYDTFNFSKLNTEFYQFNREKFLANTPLKQRLSSGSIKYDSITTNEDLIKVGIKYLLKFSHSIFKYVTKENKLVIDFTFKSSSSYCDLVNNKIVIDTNILSNEEVPKQLRIDTLQGIIFHEFLHKRITITGIADYLEIPIEEYYWANNNELILKFLENYVDGNIKRHIWNILEDFRIEKLGVKDFPGYGFYLDESRKYAYFHLANRKFIPEATFTQYAIDYLMIVILMPELREDTLNKVNEILDHDSKLYKNYYSFIEKIDKCILKYKIYIYGNTFEDIKTGVEYLYKIFEEFPINEKDASKLPNFSKGNPYAFNQDKEWNKFGKLNKSQQKELEDLIGELINELTADIDKKTGGNNIVCVVEKIKSVNEQSNVKEIKIFKQPPESPDKYIIKEAKKISQSICSNLGFLSARLNKVNNNYELAEGEIDEAELHSISYNKNIFFTENLIKGYELDLCILLDESGSMAYNIKEATIACLSLVFSFQNDKHINLSVYGHTADHDYDGHGIAPICLLKYYDTKENFTNMNTLFGIESRANNADGFAIEKVCELMEKSKNKNKVLIVVSDGSPHASCYNSGFNGVQHTHDVIKKYEARGFYIIQICMDNISNSDSMFTHYIPYERNKQFSQNLKNVLKKKLNQFHNQV